MKKTILAISAIATLLLAGCSKENNGQEPVNGKEVTLTASVPDTKVSETISGLTSTFSWQNGDAIGVLTTGNKNVQFTTTSTSPTGTFTGTIADGDAIGNYAFYPYISGASVSGSVITVALPYRYTYVAGATNMFMVGNISGSDISFTPAGGVIKFTISNIPTTAKGCRFTADASYISGTSYIDASNKTIATSSKTGKKYVTIDFSSDTYAASRTFFIPVQDTTIAGFTIGLLDGIGTDAKQFYSLHSSKSISVEAKETVVLPSIDVPDMTSATTVIPSAFTDGKSVNLYNEYVIAVGKSGFIISDNPVSGTNLYCYSTATHPAIGDKVNVSGKVVLYNNSIFEVSSPDFSIVSNSNSFSYPTSATDITSSFGTYTGNTNKTCGYVKFTGTLAISGTYYNITVGTNTIKGSLSLADAAAYAKYDGQTVTVTGYYIGQSTSSSVTYQNLIPVSISSDPFFNLPNSSASVSSNAGSIKFSVNANVDWTAAAASGNTMSISSVVADKAAGTITVTYAANTESSAKTGVINVVTTDGNITTKTLTFTITQSAYSTYSRADLETVTATSSYGKITSTTGWVGANARAIVMSNIYKTGSSTEYATAFCINGKTSTVGTITSPSLTGGCGTLSFDYENTFSESNGMSVKVEIIQSGSTIATQTVTNTTVTKSTKYSWSHDFNISGNFTIKITNLCPTGSTSNADRLSICNIVWTNHE